jgi:hypothetical protein
MRLRKQLDKLLTGVARAFISGLTCVVAWAFALAGDANAARGPDALGQVRQGEVHPGAAHRADGRPLPAGPEGVRVAQIAIGGGGFQIGIGGHAGPRRAERRRQRFDRRRRGHRLHDVRPRRHSSPRRSLEGGADRVRETRRKRHRKTRDRHRVEWGHECRQRAPHARRRCRRRPPRPIVVITPPPVRIIEEDERTPPRRSRPRRETASPLVPLAPEPRGAPPPPTQRTALPPLPAPLPPAVTTEQDFWPDEIVVQLLSAMPAQTEAELAQTHNLTLIGSEANSLIGRRIVHYRIGDGRGVQDVVAALMGDARVNAVQPNWRYRLSETRAAAQTQAPAALQYAAVTLGLAGAHAIARGTGVKVAVIDSGIDGDHPALDGRVAARFDAAGGQGPAVGAHGTAIAGILAAKGLLVGVAPAAEVLGVRAFFQGDGGGAEVSSTVILLRALDWAVGQGARVVNMSFAGPRDAAIQAAVAAARPRGAILVAAAGNGGPDAAPAYPAAYPEVIAVTATDAQDNLYGDANRGAYIDVAAPGVDIFVVAPNRGYRHSSGTSLAAAHVSGLVALLLERESELQSEAVAGALERAAADLGPPGPDEAFGAGRVDGAGLMKAATFKVAKPAAQ